MIKEGFRDEDPERLRQKAGDYVSHMGNVALARRKKVKFLRNLGKVLAGAAVGVAFMLIVIFGCNCEKITQDAFFSANLMI